MSEKRNPFAASVFPREEYFYRDKDRLLAPRLDKGERFGTYGMIVIEVLWYYPALPGRLYHPINNREEAVYWSNFYLQNSTPQRQDVRAAYFVPAPDQRETGTFVEPEEVVPPIPPDVDVEKWYDYIFNADAYTTFPNVVNSSDFYYTGGD